MSYYRGLEAKICWSYWLNTTDTDDGSVQHQNPDNSNKDINSLDMGDKTKYAGIGNSDNSENSTDSIDIEDSAREGDV